MDNLQVGDKVCNRDDDGMFFRGTVCGHGWAHGTPMVLVQLYEGNYIRSASVHSYVSILVVCTDNIQLDKRE